MKTYEISIVRDYLLEVEDEVNVSDFLEAVNARYTKEQTSVEECINAELADMKENYEIDGKLTNTFNEKAEVIW